MPETRAEYLAKILLIQNIIGQLPDEQAMFSFLCRGVMDLPGVSSARFLGEGAETGVPVPEELRMPVSIGGRKHGELLIQASDYVAFSPYQAFVSNLCFTLSLILEERRQRKVIQQHQDELEERVNERTRQLSEEKEMLAVTLRSIGDGVITTDVNGRILHVNKIAESLTGWKQHEAAGHPLEEVFAIFNSETRRPCDSLARQVLSSGLSAELPNHTVLRARDGTERPVADIATPIRDRASCVIGVVIVFRDMTEKQRLQEALQRNDRIEALGVLAGGIAHDFNNLLAGLFGFIDLARETAADPEQAATLDRALGVFDRAKSLTQQLLTFAKGGVPVKKIASLTPLLRDCATFALSGSPITRSFEIEASLHLCEFDPNQLAQVIDNMVINAKQAMPQGGHVRITAHNVTLAKSEKSTLPKGDYECIGIADNGPGIAPDKLPHIFDPFFTTKETGSGLGLATCHSIIHKHDGLIEVESTVGKGTSFRIYLPASRKGVVDAAQTGLERHHGSGRILVVDDEECLLEVMSRMLAVMGYEVSTARDGEAALSLWQREAGSGEAPFKAAFLDLTIRGGMGGQRAVRELRALGARIPIFATSGYSGDPVISHPGDFGFDGSLVKPFTLLEFSAFLEARFPSKP
jgi:PAS domain S-box-containing protein